MQLSSNTVTRVHDGRITWPAMGAGAAGGRVLVASNRGPVSFTLGADGRLTARRGGGGMVSGLSSVAEHGRRAVGLRRAQRRRPGGRARRRRAASASTGRRAARRCGCSTSRRPSSTGPTTRWRTPRCGSCTTCSTTRRTSRSSGRPSAGSGSRSGPTTRRSRRRWRDAGAARAAPVRARVVQDYHLSPGPADAGRPAPGRADRALLAHAVGAARLLPDAARRRRPGGPGRHPRRRPRRVPRASAGPTRSWTAARRSSGAEVDRAAAAGQLPGPRHRHRRAPARRGRRRADPPARPSRTCRPGWPRWPRRPAAAS